MVDGAFTVTANPQSVPNCRLRALPAGTNPNNSYVASFSGPILYTDDFSVSKDGTTPYAFDSSSGEGQGFLGQSDAGSCGIEILTTIQTPTMHVPGPTGNGCVLSLPGGNDFATASGDATASAVEVDGHDAYLPSSVESYLIQEESLALTPTTLTVTRTVAADGDVTVTESGPFVRCSVSDAYPPTTTSCPSLVPTGVTYRRTSTFIRQGHQDRVRDAFVSTDGKTHRVDADYQSSLPHPASGTSGFAFPGGSTFAAPAPGSSDTGFVVRAGSLGFRSDIRSTDGDDGTDALAVTWSRAPYSVHFSAGGGNDWAMPYILTVPAHGTAYLGLTLSEGSSLAPMRALAAQAVADDMATPTITSPHAGKVSSTVTVKGTVAIGANGLPIAVTVNGHVAHLTRTATSEAYTYRLTLKPGTHKVTAIAHDSAGNTRTRFVVVHVKPAHQKKHGKRRR